MFIYAMCPITVAIGCKAHHVIPREHSKRVYFYRQCTVYGQCVRLQCSYS